MDDELHLSQFELELIHRLRTLPFAMRQHVARYVLRLQKEDGVEDGARPAEPAVDKGTPVWDLTHDDLWRLRSELEGDGPEGGEGGPEGEGQ
jgi:hypothetical protein